ncbi:MAG TPA: carboxypeptidase-like regulatory domain-containing protein, partial [Pyrinomonadaceae bacterium]|nr:carboxypeptidase-like regulatory domain-containing protein [Pyrinomonadaceae bacterium]
MKRNSITAILFATYIFLSAFGVSAQTDQGRISGQVTDQTGAIVPGATVVVTNNGTKQSRTVTASDEGQYVVTPLRAAVYTIVVNAPTFAAKTITDVEV